MNIREDFTSNLEDRGLSFSFMWIDAEKHSHLVTDFGVEKFPSVVILNHSSSKMKYVRHDPDVVTESSLGAVLNSIISGDARFTKLKYSSAELLLK